MCEVDYEDKLEIEKKEDMNRGRFVSGNNPNSGKGSRLLQHLNSFICIGTEDGQLVYVDWIPQKDSDSSKLMSKFMLIL